MKRFLVLTRFKKEYEPARLSQEATSLSLSSNVISYDSLVPSGKDGINYAGIPGKFEFLPDDLVVMRSSAHFYCPSLIKTKQFLLTRVKNTQGCLNYGSYKKNLLISKLDQAETLSRASLASIPTTYLASKAELVSYLGSACFPLMMKGRFGSHSRQVFRVDSVDESLEVASRWENGCLIQPLYRSYWYWRVLVLGGQGMGAIRRKTSHRFFDNGYEFDIEKSKLIDLACRATEAFAAEFAGVDLLADPSGNPVVIEVNRAPQFKIFEKLSGLNVARQIVQYLLEG